MASITRISSLSYAQIRSQLHSKVAFFKPGGLLKVQNPFAPLLEKVRNPHLNFWSLERLTRRTRDPEVLQAAANNFYQRGQGELNNPLGGIFYVRATEELAHVVLSDPNASRRALLWVASFFWMPETLAQQAYQRLEPDISSEELAELARHGHVSLRDRVLNDSRTPRWVRLKNAMLPGADAFSAMWSLEPEMTAGEFWQLTRSVSDLVRSALKPTLRLPRTTLLQIALGRRDKKLSTDEQHLLRAFHILEGIHPPLTQAEQLLLAWTAPPEVKQALVKGSVTDRFPRLVLAAHGRNSACSVTALERLGDLTPLETAVLLWAAARPVQQSLLCSRRDLVPAQLVRYALSDQEFAPLACERLREGTPNAQFGLPDILGSSASRQVREDLVKWGASEAGFAQADLSLPFATPHREALLESVFRSAYGADHPLLADGVLTGPAFSLRPEEYEALAFSVNPKVKWAIATPDCPRPVLFWLALSSQDDYSLRAFQALAGLDPPLEPTELGALSYSAHERVRQGIIPNLSTPRWALLHLARSPRSEGLLAYQELSWRGPTLALEELDPLAESENEAVRKEVAMRPDTFSETIAYILAGRKMSGLEHIGQPHYHPEDVAWGVEILLSHGRMCRREILMHLDRLALNPPYAKLLHAALRRYHREMFWQKFSGETS